MMTEATTNGVALFLIISVCSIWLLYLTHGTICDNWGDKYYQDSMCFDVNFRCQVECAEWDRNFTGVIINGCNCECGDGIVSYCSGFFYPYNQTA